MGLAFLCLLFLAGRVLAGLHSQEGGQESRDCSTFTDRTDKLECLILQQDVKLTTQEDQLSRLTSLLHQQNAKLSIQEDLFRRQGAELSRLKTLLRRQNLKVSSQQSLLLRQNKILQRLLSRNHQGHEKHQQAGKLVQFSPDRMSDITNMSNLEILNQKAVTSHDVIARSDDAGPLELVVSHISQQVTEMNANIQAFQAQTTADIWSLKNSTMQQAQDIQNTQSSTFVRWGSSQCDASSQLVYPGVAGGSWYDHSGAATNLLCLTLSPVLSDTHAPEPLVAYLYGTEYETQDAYYQKDTVCAMCRSKFPTTIMIPGTKVCTPGWHLHYSGYLMGGYYAHKAGSEYICVDSRLQSSAHSEADQNGATLFYTVTRCGSLPCSPYVNDKVVTCVVCGK